MLPNVLSVVAFVLATLLLLAAVLALRTRRDARALEQRFPPIGEVLDVEDCGQPRRVHVLDVPGNPALLPVVFIHGSSGNLRDQAGAFRDAVARLPHARRFRSIYVDRPGCGYTERRASDATPIAQAATVRALLDRLGIERAVLCGHSFGAGVAVTTAAEHPGRVASLALLAPAAYPWPGDLSWPWRLASVPGLRSLCAWTFVMPLGRRLVGPGIAGTFHPDPVPEGYRDTAAIDLLLRPANFLANAADLLAIKARAAEITPSFRAVGCPAWILQGGADAVVRPTIHAVGLHRALRDARMEWHEDVGHKPDYVLRERIVARLASLAAGEGVAEASDYHRQAAE